MKVRARVDKSEAFVCGGVPAFVVVAALQTPLGIYIARYGIVGEGRFHRGCSAKRDTQLGAFLQRAQGIVRRFVSTKISITEHT
jgi:hypothetical protein